MHIFGEKFRSFWTPKGVKMEIFEKSLNTLLDGYLNIIYAKFQLYSPYRFQNSRLVDNSNFRSKSMEFLDP